ncbi:MAG: hypothetical protein J0M22_09940 [Gammaproteobacteria bacterium]|nr:hypothetical protein [Gammaproteobacteria bacterium]
MAVSLSKIRHAQQLAVRGFFLVLTFTFSQFAYSHTFFESIVNIETNPKSGKLEIVHSYTLHDLTAVLMAQTQLAINLEHPEHEAVLQHYIERHFKLRQGDDVVELQWVGIQITPQLVEIYQESTEKQDLTKLELQQTVLQDSLAKQINRVNFQQGEYKGTVIFSGDRKWRQLR